MPFKRKTCNAGYVMLASDVAELDAFAKTVDKRTLGHTAWMQQKKFLFDFDYMQGLAESGAKAYPVTGIPVFDPCKLDEDTKAVYQKQMDMNAKIVNGGKVSKEAYTMNIETLYDGLLASRKRARET